MKVLICDDSTLIRNELKGNLSKLDNIEIIEAENGQAAVDIYKDHKPSIVFMDIVMPEMDGIEAVREIMAYDKNAKIVMLSSAGTKNNLREALEAGACDFIKKPWYELQVLSAVNRFAKGC